MPTLTEARTRWLTDRYRAREINRKSYTVMSARFRHLETIHAGRPLDQLDRDTIRRWMRHIGHLTPATRRAYLSTIGTFCRWAVEEHLLAADPTERVARIREPRRVPRARTRTEIARILTVASRPRERLMVLLMVEMGLRCIEVSRLQVADYDRWALTMLIHGKRDNERMLPVPAPVADTISEYRDTIGWRPGPLICSETGWHPVSTARVSWVVTDLMYRAGVKHAPGDGIGPHALRHTAASDVLDVCGNVRTVQQMLGHSSLATTQIYLRGASLGQLREAMAGRTYTAP